MEGYTGVLPTDRARKPPDSGAGPGRPTGPGVGGQEAGRVSLGVRRAGTVLHPPFGTGRSPGPPWCRTLQIPASGPITARFQVFLLKVSQNRIVSPEMCEKACHSPYSQNGLGNHALDFLRFPFPASFSHKELIGPF